MAGIYLQPWSLASGERIADEQTRAVATGSPDQHASVRKSDRAWFVVPGNSYAVEIETRSAVPGMKGQRHWNSMEVVLAAKTLGMFEDLIACTECTKRDSADLGPAAGYRFGRELRLSSAR
jgi:hypothetical protein